MKGFHRVALRDKLGKIIEVKLALKYRNITILPPIGTQKSYPRLQLTVLHATEVGPPASRTPIEWKLITDLPVHSRAQAVEKLNWYAMRWKIELLHKILKSGCKAEDSKLRTAQRLTNLIAIFCLVAWRIFWMTMLQRCAPNCSAWLALTRSEMGLLQRLVRKKSEPHELSNVADCLLEIAKLGGYLARSRDPPPGNTVMWRGLTRLADMQFGVSLLRTYG